MIISLKRENSRADLEDIQFLLDSSRSPPYYAVYLRRFLEEPRGDHQELIQVAWRTVLDAITAELKTITQWSEVLQYLIEQGADVHQVLYGTSTAYIQAMSEAQTPFEADESLHAWLSTLQTCGVPIGPYIECETQYVHEHAVTSWFFNRWNRRVVHIDFDGISTPSWRWIINPGGKAFEVLDEFQNLGPGLNSFLPESPFIRGPNDWRPWLVASEISRKKTFPFRTAPLDCCTGHEYWLAAHGREAYKRAREVREGRLARREARKWRKEHPRARPPTRVMPGSWVD